jgi:hypothetical protein
MTRSKFGLLALCAVVFGVMSFGAASAHAELGATWLILMSDGKVLTGAELNASINGEKDTLLILLTEVLKIPTQIDCEKFKIENAKLIELGAISEGFIVFEECKILLNGVVNANCTPHSKGRGAGIVATEPSTGLIKLHKLEPSGVKDETVLILPVNAEMRFSTLEMAEACPIGEKLPVFGKFSIKECKNEFLKHLAKHLIEEFAPLTELWVITKTAEHKAIIDGSAWVFLTGAHAGLAWAGDPA